MPFPDSDRPVDILDGNIAGVLETDVDTIANAFVDDRGDSRLLPQLPRHGLRPITPRQNAGSVAQHDQPARILGHPAAIDPLVQAHD
jgi:hypothetical protein